MQIVSVMQFRSVFTLLVKSLSCCSGACQDFLCHLQISKRCKFCEMLTYIEFLVLLEKNNECYNHFLVFVIETMFCVLSSGDILKVRTDKNPCRVVKTWKCEDPEKGKV